MPRVQPLRNAREARVQRTLVWSKPSMSYQRVLPAVMPSFWAAATAVPASANPCLRALVYSPCVPGSLLITRSLPYRGKRGLHGAWGPRVIGRSFQPLWSWVLTQVGVRFGWLRHAREAPEV